MRGWSQPALQGEATVVPGSKGALGGSSLRSLPWPSALARSLPWQGSVTRPLVPPVLLPCARLPGLGRAFAWACPLACAPRLSLRPIGLLGASSGWLRSLSCRAMVSSYDSFWLRGQGKKQSHLGDGVSSVERGPIVMKCVFVCVVRAPPSMGRNQKCSPLCHKPYSATS